MLAKKLTPHGNSLALVFDRAILNMIDIDKDTPLQIRTDGKNLIISPLTDPELRRQFEASIAKADRKYARMFKRLAE